MRGFNPIKFVAKAWKAIIKAISFDPGISDKNLRLSESDLQTWERIERYQGPYQI